MPITKSAKKALRQNIRRRTKNLSQQKTLKKTIKEYRKLIADGDKEKAGLSLPTVFKKIDKAAKANLIKKNKANRLKSRLSRKLGTPAQTSN